jgi:hypothetical protein
MRQPKERPPLNFLRELCRDLPPEEVQEAENNFWRYLETVHTIFDRLQCQTANAGTPRIPTNDSTD